MAEKTPRICYWLDETAWTPMGYIPSVVTEGEPGHTPLVGDPEKGQAPWYWGTDLETAKFLVRQANKELGLTEEDAREIVLSSMGAGAVHQDRHDTDGKPYIGYFRRDLVTGFLWSGNNDDPVQVTAEMSEPVTETFEVSIAQDQDTADVLAEFKRQCDEWAEVDRG